MVAELTNTYLTVLGGQTTDAYGDLQDAATVQTAHVPAFLAETRQTVWDPVAQEPRTVRTIQARISTWTTIQAGFESQQLVDETTGDVYFVEDVIYPPTIIGAPVDLRLTLRRVTGPSV
jgi:hypothetical protein